MTESDSTCCSNGDSTQVESDRFAPGGLPSNSAIAALEGGLAGALRQDPRLARNRSIVIEKAVDEFLELSSQNPSLSFKDYARRFAPWGSSIASSIYRQLEVEQYFLAPERLRVPSAEIRWPTTGSQINSFQVIEELGRGALAKVYLCRDLEVGGRQVVVKVCQTVASEAHTLGQLRHRNIVPVYSVGHDDQIHAAILCMPFLGRSTLFDLVAAAWEHGCPTTAELILRAGRIWEQPADRIVATTGLGPPSRAHSYVEGVTYLATQLADALHHAHSQGVVHGDVKPSNILLTPEGEPLLVDFNLSGNLALATTARGGTLPYMPPEQLWGIARATDGSSSYDARSDVYSLGIVLYELLTGGLPFAVDGANANIADAAGRLLQVQRTGCAPLRVANNTVPNSLAKIVERCLAWEPNRRFGSARELRDALQAENRPVKRLGRRIHANRRLVLRLVIAIVMAGAAWVSVEAYLGPRQLRYYARGLEFQGAGDVDNAALQFERALKVAPDFRDAKFELARMMVAQRKLEAAETMFFELTKSSHDPRSEAFVGYCRSLRRQDVLAIPWYVRALESGYTCGEVHNNLAVAYDLGDRASSMEARFNSIETHLDLALTALPDCDTVKFNWIDYELNHYARAGRSISPRAIRFADQLVASQADCGDVLFLAARAYCLAPGSDPSHRPKVVELLRRAFELGHAPSLAALANDPTWTSLRSLPEFRTLIDEVQRTPRQAPQGPSMPRVLEPGMIKSRATARSTSS